MRRGFEVARAAWWIAALLIFSAPRTFAELTAHDQSVELIASIWDDPPEIILQWLPDPNAQTYQISRKVLGEQNWTALTTVGGGDTAWRDGSVSIGVAYEYQIVKNTNLGYTGWGYACVAIRRAVVEDRGKMILLVEQDLGGALAPELSRLQQDLVGDGWTVVRRDVDKMASVVEVKNLLRDLYNADRAGTKGLFLFGHIPVPYSGDICPDMHSDDQGAWPADVYYAELEGEWTDFAVNNTNYFNSNIPGDGKFDQSVPPGPVRLQMGRVDLSNLTCFANKTPPRSELDLARQYLVKDHDFRHGKFAVQRRAMIFDRFSRGLEPEPQTCAAWRSFPGFFGRDQVRTIGQYEYFPILNNDSYMWSYVVSGGSIYGCDYIGTSDDWALNEPKVVFTSFLGSWFGQWEKESDFLRAPLGASGYTLAAIFSGQPQWILHPMGMGETIGYAAMLTQNNNMNNGIYPPQLNAGAGQVHIDLMGDPSLRMHVVKPPGALSGVVGNSGVALTWTASPDSGVLGYYVYKSTSLDGPFARVSGPDSITTTSFNDASGDANSFYMVRALKLEQTPTGSFYNLSQGAFYPDSSSSAAGVPGTPTGVSIGAIVRGAVDVGWIANPMNVRAFEIQRRALPNGLFEKIGEAPNTASLFHDTNLSAGLYAYRVKALGFAGDSDFSGEASLNFNPSWGAILGTDTSTGGYWIGKYGKEGYAILGAGTNLPSYLNLTMGNVSPFVGAWNTDDEPETLFYPDGKHRLESAWFTNHRVPMVFSLRFNDSQPHRVTLYMLDYQATYRSGTVSVVDPFTGEAFGSVYFTNYTRGEYVTVDVRNYADIVVSAEFPDQFGVPVNGIFFDASTAPPTNGQVVPLGSDTTTQGDWASKYGKEGQMIPGWKMSLPAGVTVNQSNQPWTWMDDTSDVRALKKYTQAGRIASAWYSLGTATFDVKLTQPKQIALYFMDWDNAGRVQDVTVASGDGPVLLARRIENFGGGRYVVFSAAGTIRISVKHVQGPNAVINGIFFGPAPAPIISTDPVTLSLPNLDVASGGYTIRVTGQPGQVFDVEWSLDFRGWTKIGQQTLSGTTLDVPMPFDTGTEVRFFRAVLAP